MSKKRKAGPAIVLAPAMTKAQVDHLQDLRKGSRSAPHLTARQRAAQRTSKTGQFWKQEAW